MELVKPHKAARTNIPLLLRLHLGYKNCLEKKNIPKFITCDPITIKSVKFLLMLNVQFCVHLYSALIKISNYLTMTSSCFMF